MSISPISSYAAQTYQTNSYYKTEAAAAKETETETKTETETAGKTAAEESGVIYEKSSSSTTKTETKDNSAIVAQLKADAEARKSQMLSYVQQMLGQQGKTIGTADDMWSFLAGGNYTVTAAAKAQAQAAIADDGYWGVEQTSDRIVEFAKALAGDDPDKADELLEAFKKGYGQATKSWGSTLPDISSRTYDAVLEKFDAWKNESSDTTAVDTTAAES